MPKSKFKTQTIDQIIHKSIMEQIDREERENYQRQLEADRRELEAEEREFERQKWFQQQRFAHEKEMSGLVNPMQYLDKVVDNATITSTIRTVGDKKEITIKILLG